MSERILLGQKVPVEVIKKPFCQRCMNPVSAGGEICDSCSNPPSIVTDWYFHRNISLGPYNSLSCPGYNNLPQNILSKLILNLKKQTKANIQTVGRLLNDGLIRLLDCYPFLLQDTKYIMIPPKNNPGDENQCDAVLTPFLENLKKKGQNLINISTKIIRKFPITANKTKTRLDRFKDIQGCHECQINNLQGSKVLVLDDVSTTLSTTWDLSRALKEKNAGEINILTLGRQISSSSQRESFPIDYDIDELLFYFSDFEYYLNPKRVNKVALDNMKIDGEGISCKSGDYDVYIDFKEKVLKHNCPDFFQRRLRNKSFCKHITKLFLDFKEELGESEARSKLNEIFTNLLEWDFKT